MAGQVRQRQRAVRRPVRLPVRPQDPRVRGLLRGRRARGRAGRGDVPPLRRRQRLHRRPAPLADGPGSAHPHREGTLGPVGDLGHAPQPRLRRHRGLRQDPGRARAGRAEPHRPPRRPHRPEADPGPGPAPGGMDGHPRPRPGRRGDVRPGAAAARRQQAVRLPQHEGPVPAAGHRSLRVLRLRLLPHHHDHHRREQDLLLPLPRLRRLPLPGRPGLRRTGPSAPTTPTRSSGTTSRPCSPTPPSSAPRSARGWKGHGHRTRSPASAASSSRPSPRPARRSTR